MDEKSNFGEVASENIKVGDIVAWSKWDSQELDWKQLLGVVLEVKNTILSNRMVCVTLVMPLKDPKIPLELFTFSLKLVSSGAKKEV
jgi:hypothetical protein